MIALSSASPLVTLSSDSTSLSSTFERRRGRSKRTKGKRRNNAEFDRLRGVGVRDGGKPRGYVCTLSKVCLLRGTRKAASNLISPESKYLRGGKRRFFTMLDIFPTFFSRRIARGSLRARRKISAIFPENRPRAIRRPGIYRA